MNHSLDLVIYLSKEKKLGFKKMKNKLPQQPNCLERYLVHYKRIKRILNTVKIGPTDKPDSFGELVRIKIYILHVSKNLMKNQKIEVMLDLSDRYTHLTELAANYHGSTNDTNDNLNILTI